MSDQEKIEQLQAELATSRMLCARYKAEKAKLQSQLEKANACLRQIIEANDEFRMSLPDDWEGDPLNDAVAAAKYLMAHTDEHGQREREPGMSPIDDAEFGMKP